MRFRKKPTSLSGEFVVTTPDIDPEKINRVEWPPAQSVTPPRADASAGLLETEECVPALSGDEAQHGLNDIFPGDPYPIRTILTQIRHCEIQALHAGLSRRDWWAVEKAANELRDKLDSLLSRISLRARAADLKSVDAKPVDGLAKARTIALEQRCERGTPWDLACVTIANKIGEQCGYPPIPTDAAPPRPDASAGLIEAAEINYILTTLKHARVFITSREKMHPTGVELYDELIEKLRARAADWSGE